MSHALLLSGSLAPKALEKRLQAEKGPVIVLEFDTMLDRGRYPQAIHWFTVRDWCDAGAIRRFYGEVREVLSYYLNARTDITEPSGDVLLRQASMQGGFPDAAFGRVLNSALATALLDRFPIQRLIVAAGCGVNFSFWRDEARKRGLELEILPSEWKRRTLRRRLERWLYKWKTPKKPKGTSAVSVTPPVSVPEDAPTVLCISRRVAKLLQDEVAAGQPLDFKLQSASIADLGGADDGLLASEKERFARWWQDWQGKALSPEALPQELASFRDLYVTTGNHAVPQIYPRWAALRQKAVDWLKSQRPAVIVADTQISDEESLWRLAAVEAGIPVVAYSYDQVADSRIMLCPDFYLVDGMRAIPRALAWGYDPQRMTEVRSHRRPSSPCRPMEQTERIFTSGRPSVLFADPMCVMADPQASLRCFRAIIGAARRLPQLDFVIKFHPLRAPKSEHRSFLGMDESEVEGKRLYALSLKPPGNVRFLPPESSMEECLKSAAILLNTTSMSGHEGFHMGIPVVFMCHHERNSITYPQMADWMQPLEAEDEEALAKVLARLAGEKEFRQSQITGQRRYLDEFYWKSKLSLSDAISTAVRRAAHEPLLPR
ncbi:MAG: hypothetical protein V4662_03420 [Verrucomicrobiota bacterium]